MKFQEITKKMIVRLPFFRRLAEFLADSAPAAETKFTYVRRKFVERMEAELISNSAHKGNWNEWQPGKELLLSEIDHHYAKFKKALAADDSAKLAEYSADLANYFMKGSEVYGENSGTAKVVVMK